MANDSKRVSQLGIVTGVGQNDRMVVLTNPGAATANLQTITVNNFFRSTNSNYFNIVSNNYVQIQYNPNTGVSGDYVNNSSWAYVGDGSFAAEIYSNTGTVKTGIYLDTNVQITANSNIWHFYSNGTTTFPGTVSIGTSDSSANGFTSLPNGMKMNWGWVSANSSAGNVTFTSAYTTNAFSVTATSNTALATYQAAVLSVNNTTAVIRTANATSTNVMWTSIGY